MGGGMIDWAGQFKALKRDGYHFAVSLETHWSGGGSPEESSRKSWAGMKKLLQQADALCRIAKEREMMTESELRRTFSEAGRDLGNSRRAGVSTPVLGANDRVRVGMIGVGDRGNDLLEQVVKVQGVELVAMADVYSRRRDQAKSKVPGIQTFDDYRRLLDMKDIDGVIVASPLHIHARHFLDTLAAGKDLYAEKTMTWSIPEADKCLAAAKASNRVVQIGLQHQSSGALTDARAMDQRRHGRQSHPGRIVDEPQHSSRQRPVGARRFRPTAPRRTSTGARSSMAVPTVRSMLTS